MSVETLIGMEWPIWLLTFSVGATYVLSIYMYRNREFTTAISRAAIITITVAGIMVLSIFFPVLVGTIAVTHIVSYIVYRVLGNF